MVCSLFQHDTELGTYYRIARCRDTVCSVGIVPRTLPFTASNTSIRFFRHAISLDERRAKFKANYYHLRHPDDEKGLKLGEMPPSNQRHPYFHKRFPHHKSKMHSDNEEYDDDDDDGHTTDYKEVWFAGCHCGNVLVVST